MLPIFKDLTLQGIFEQNGFVKLSTPLLNDFDVKELKHLYENIGFYDRNTYNPNIKREKFKPEQLKTIRDKTNEIALPELDNFLYNYKSIFAEFLSKDPNPKSIIPAHQDWTFVDYNNDYCTISCVIALTDISFKNGALGFTKGSHTIDEINCPPSPSPIAPLPLIDFIPEVFTRLEFVEMKAGEALFFDNRTFHGSLPNCSESNRLYVRLNLVHKSADIFHYYLKPDGEKSTILKYEIDEDFFLNYTNEVLVELYENNKTIPGYKLIDEFPYRYSKYNSNELIDILESLGNEFDEDVCNEFFEDCDRFIKKKPKENLFSNLKRLFNA